MDNDWKQSRQSQRYRSGRRRENIDRNQRYYALNERPNRSEFGAPHFVDNIGRQYRMAFLTPRPLNPNPEADYSPSMPPAQMRLYVKLNRHQPWMEPDDVLRMQCNEEDVPEAWRNWASSRVKQVSVDSVWRPNPTHRVASIDVTVL